MKIDVESTLETILNETGVILEIENVRRIEAALLRLAHSAYLLGERSHEKTT